MTFAAQPRSVPRLILPVIGVLTGRPCLSGQRHLVLVAGPDGHPRSDQHGQLRPLRVRHHNPLTLTDPTGFAGACQNNDGGENDDSDALLDVGLGGSVWGNDVDEATKHAEKLECGTAWVNQHGALHPLAPFGGVKCSGIGVEFNVGLAEIS